MKIYRLFNMKSYLNLLFKLTLFEAVSIVFTLFSLFLSLFSIYYSNKALSITKMQFIQDRSLVLKAKIDAEERTVTFQSINDKSNLINGLIIFPDKISSNTFKINSYENKAHLTEIFTKIKDNIYNEITPSKDQVIGALDVKIPVLIDSYYTSHGEPFRDLSLYFMDMSFFVYEDKYKKIELKINDFYFIDRLNGNIHKNYLNELFDKKSLIHTPQFPKIENV